MHLGHRNKEAYASVIIMVASPDWRQLPVLGLRLTGKEIAADNAYIMKMLARLDTALSNTKYLGKESELTATRLGK